MTCLTLFAFLAIANQPGIRTLFDKENTVAAENSKNPEGIIFSDENDALTVGENRKDDPGTHLQLADELQKDGKDHEAAQEYLKAGRIFIEEDRFDEGIKALVEAINLQGGLKDADPEIVQMVTEILFFSAVDENLAPMYDHAAGRFPNWDVLKICEARSYLHREQMVRTQALLDEVLARNPDSHLAKTVMAEMYFMSGRKNEAIALVEELLNYSGLPDWLDEYLHQLEQDFR
jgi:tetratricopeptide (TPR) repeat protein